MHNNEHNPIAIRIDKVHKLWERNRNEKPESRVFIVTCSQEDFMLINGFIQIEASQYGKSKDSFLMFSIDFNEEKQFLYDFLKEWILSFKRDLKKYTDWQWDDFETFEKEFDLINQENSDALWSFFYTLLVSFKKFESKKDNLIIIGLLPKKVSDYQKFQSFLGKLISRIPIDYGLLLIDFAGKEKYNELSDSISPKVLSQIYLPDQNMSSSYKELATQGNPNDPQVKFRKCLFELGESAARKNKEEVDYWGKRMLDITQSTGDRAFWASGHLMYASFLFGFKDDKNIFRLLDKGIKILEVENKNDPQKAGVLMQLYSFKASYYSIIGKRNDAVDNFIVQAKIAEDMGMIEQMILANIYALLLIKDTDNIYKQIINKSFKKGYTLNDDLLKVINFAFITEKYIELNINSIPISEKQEIENRMETIYGENWREYAKKISTSIKMTYEKS